MLVGEEPVKRVEIILEAVALPEALEVISRAGATGYTIIPQVHGKGRRGVRSDLGFSEVMRNAMIIVVAPAGVAESVAAGVGRLLEEYAGLLTVVTVEHCVGLDQQSPRRNA